MANTKIAKKDAALAKKGKALKVPSKRTMNFVHHEASFNPVRMLPVIVLLLVIAGVFVKFGILDLTEQKMMAYQEVSTKQVQLTGLVKSAEGYDEVAYQYGRYSYGWMNEGETNMVNRMDVLRLIEEKIGTKCVVENIAITDNVLTTNIHGLTLEEASNMVEILEGCSIVSSATIYSAVAQDAGEASIFLSINLQKEAAENE